MANQELLFVIINQQSSLPSYFTLKLFLMSQLFLSLLGFILLLV